MKKRRKINWNARIDWFDDWREWFGPKTYGIGYTAKRGRAQSLYCRLYHIHAYAQLLSVVISRVTTS